MKTLRSKNARSLLQLSAEISSLREQVDLLEVLQSTVGLNDGGRQLLAYVKVAVNARVARRTSLLNETAVRQCLKDASPTQGWDRLIEAVEHASLSAA